MDEFFDDIIDRGERQATSMSTLPSASVVTPCERAAANHAIDVAIARLGCPRPTLRFVFAGGRARGQAEHRPDGHCVVTLNLAELRTTLELAEVTFHEVAHCEQMHAGQFSRLSIPERERRADTFAREMVQQEKERLCVAIAAAAFQETYEGDIAEAPILRGGNPANEPFGLDTENRTTFERLGADGAAPRVQDSPEVLVSLTEVRQQLRAVMGDLRKASRYATDSVIPKMLTTRSVERDQLQQHIAASFSRAQRSLEGWLMRHGA